MSHAPRHPKSTHRAQHGDEGAQLLCVFSQGQSPARVGMSQRRRCTDLRTPDSSRSRGMAIADLPMLRAPECRGSRC